MGFFLGARPPKATARCPHCKRKYTLSEFSWDDNSKCAVCREKEWESWDDEQSKLLWNPATPNKGTCKRCGASLAGQQANAEFCLNQECYRIRHREIKHRSDAKRKKKQRQAKQKHA